MAPERLDLSRRPTRLVPMVLQVLYGPAIARRGCPPDQAMEGHAAPHRANRPQLRAGRLDLSPAPAPSLAPLGLRQPQVVELLAIPRVAVWPARAAPSAPSADDRGRGSCH